MLQNQLQAVKGELLAMMFNQYLAMNTDTLAIDYSSFYEEVLEAIQDIKSIHNLSDLEKFCEEYGLNDADNEMSFLKLVERAYK
jgi:hypothetical protein